MLGDERHVTASRRRRHLALRLGASRRIFDALAHNGIRQAKQGGQAQKRRAIVGHVGVAHAADVGLVVELDVLRVVVDELAHALLAAARHRADAQRAVEVEVQQRLDVERVADDGNALGQAAAAVQDVEVVDHEERADAVARLLGPHDEALGVHAGVALVARLVKKQREGRRRHEGVHDVDADLLVGMGLLQALEAHDGAVVAAGKPARDAEEHGGDARLVGGLEGLVVLELGRLRSHGHGAVADRVVELVGAARLEEVVVARKAAVGLICLDVVERQDGHAALRRLFGGEVARGVAHDVALYGQFGSSRPRAGRCIVRSIVRPVNGQSVGKKGA